MTNIKATIEVITGVVEKLKKSILREDNYFKEIENDKAALARIEELADSGEALPADCPYESYAEWIEDIKKQIKASETSIKRISVEKHQLTAFEYFLENAEENPQA